MADISLDGVLLDVGNKNEKYEKFPPTKLAWDIKGAGVVSTVVQKQGHKTEIKDPLRKANGNTMTGLPDPFCESLRGKRKLRNQSQLSKNSKALDRLKEKIQRQKERSPVAADKLPQQQIVQTLSGSFLDDTELCTRKITKGPIAPKYKGFNSAITRIKTVSGQPTRQATPSDLYVSRARNESKASEIRISRVEAPPKRTKVTARDGSSLERKTMITPSSWRQGQHIAESILGPPVKHPRQARKQDTSVSKPETKEANTRQARQRHRHHDLSVPRAQGDENSVVTRPVSAPPVTRSVVKHKRPDLDMEPEKEKQPKIRHYDQNAVQQYIVKKKEERKRQKSQERKAYKEAQSKKQKQLEELYRRQKKYAVPKKRPLVEDENCPPDDCALSAQLMKPNTQIRDDMDGNADAEEHGSLARFDQRASEIMERLTSFGPRSTAGKPFFGNEESDLVSKTVPFKVAPTPTVADDSYDIVSANMEKVSAPSEFMKKLDQYLDEGRADFDAFGKQTTSRSAHMYPERPDSTRIEFGSGFVRSATYGTNVQDDSPSANLAKRSGMDQSPSNEYLSTVRMRAERIAALKSRADTLNEKMDATLKLVEQPIVPATHNLDDVDKILRKDFAASSSGSLPNVEEILRKYDMELSLPALPGSNLRSNWTTAVQNPVPDDPVMSPMKHDAPASGREASLREDSLLSQPVLEASFSSRLKSFEKVSDTLSSHTLSQQSDNDEISEQFEHAVTDEYQSHNVERFHTGREEFGKNKTVRSPTVKSKVTKAPWEIATADKHSIINLCVGRIIKGKENKHRLEQPVDVPDSQGGRSDLRVSDGTGMETEDSFTSSISKDISPISTPKNIMPKKHYDDVAVLSDMIQPSPKRTQLPQAASPRMAPNSLPFVEEFETKPTMTSHRTDIKDQDTITATEEASGVDDAVPFVPKFSKPMAQRLGDYTQKFSPAALEQKLHAELNYQDSIEETLRHLTGVEKTQSTSAAQQDSVSLAQLVKTQQLLHGFELEKERIKALARIRRQAPTDYRKGASPRSVGSHSRTTDTASSPSDKDFGSRKNAKSSTYRDDHFSSSSSPTNTTEDQLPSDSVESVPENLPQEDKDKTTTGPTLRKETFSDKYASDESGRRSPYDKKRPARKFGHSYQPEKSTKHKNETPSFSTDIASDSSATSVHFDESLTEDEIAEISLRAVVASEGHRRRHRSRSNVPLKKFEEGYETLKASHAMERGNEKNSEFFQFMDELVQRYMQEEEFRTHHQEAMLFLRKRAIKEKTEAELAMLKKMKKQARKKGEDEKMPPLEKKQRAILRRYKMENAEIKKLKAMAKVSDQGRKYFIQQNVGRRAKRDDFGDIRVDISDSAQKENEEKLDTTSPDAVDQDNSSIGDSNSDISTSSSVLKLKTNVKALDEQKLTKREKLLMKRKKQAEQLIAWKKRLDREEQQICNIEKKALRTWDNDIPAKQGKKKTVEKISDQDASSDSNVNTAASLTESSIAEEIESGTTDSIASQSVVLPTLPGRGDVRPRSSSSETIQEDDSQYSDFPLETQDVTKPKTDSTEKNPTDSISKAAPRSEQTVDAKPATDSEPVAASRKDSLETWSDESVSQTPSETEQSDIECRVRALREELNRRRLIAERLKKKQKQRHKDRLKAQEASLRSQIEAYDIFIRKTQDELKQELGGQPSGVVAKPQIRSPQKNHQGRQQLLQSSLASEASAISGHVNLAGVAYQRSESESSDKSRTNEEEDTLETPNDASPGTSMRSGVHEKRESAIPKFNKQMTTGGISRSLFSAGAKPKSLIPVPSRNSAVPKLSSSVLSPAKEIPQEGLLVKKSLDSDLSSPTTLEKKWSESEDDISEHIDEISNVSSEKHLSVDHLPLLDLTATKTLSSPEEQTAGERRKDSFEKEDTGVTSPLTSPSESKAREDLPAFKIGDRVVVAGRDTGVVRFVGETNFAKGLWVGVELQSTIGKNDGSVNGTRYFTCSRNRGIFAPPAKITLVSDFPGPLPLSPKKDNALDFLKPTDDESRSESSSSSSLSSQKEASREEPATEKSERKESNVKLADRLTSGLLDSLLEDSMDHILHQYSERKSRNDEGQNELDDAEPESQPLLKSKMHDDGKAVDDQDTKPDVDVRRRSNLADSFSDDLFRDTVEKVIEIRKQRAMKWSSEDVQHEEYDNIRSPSDGKMDYGKEVEDILGMKGNRMIDDDSDTDEKESMTPVRPVSPILGGQDEWIEDDISACIAKPIIARENLSTDKDIWKDGRFIEALSDFFEPSPIPKEFAVDHDSDQILKLVENTVSAFYSRHIKGEDIDTFVPDVIFDKTPKKAADDDIANTIDVTVKKKQDVDANHVFNMSLIDMVREFMTEVFTCKNRMEARSATPKWQKKRVSSGPMYKKIPKTEEEFQTYVTKKVSKLLNLHTMNKRSKRIGMKWGSHKKDRVDVILIRELREEEPEWTNYDKDETTVKMQLTDTILDLLLSDSIHCLNEIHGKKMKSYENESYQI